MGQLLCDMLSCASFSDLRTSISTFFSLLGFCSFILHTKGVSHTWHTIASYAFNSVQTVQTFSDGTCKKSCISSHESEPWHRSSVPTESNVPPNPRSVSLFRFLTGCLSTSLSSSCTSFASRKSKISFANIRSSSTVTSFSWSSCPRKKSRWQIVGILKLSWIYHPWCKNQFACLFKDHVGISYFHFDVPDRSLLCYRKSPFPVLTYLTKSLGMAYPVLIRICCRRLMTWQCPYILSTK